MIADAREFDPGFTLEADLCIVGTGAAGLTLATSLMSSRLSICLLESGGFELEPDTQDLYAGEYAGGVPSLDHDYVRNSRLRMFGGTTNIWAGYCRTLEPIDFEQREWVPHSGWPFSKADLDPWYRRAAEFMGLRPFDSDNPDEGDDTLPAVLDDEVFQGKVFQQQPIRFGQAYRDDIGTSSSLKLVHHANVIEVVPESSSSTVSHLRVATLTGITGTVRAKVFVLAAGGIENCRLLLASDSVHPFGLGNRHGVVGRYFMEHPVTRFGMGPMLFWPTRSLDLYHWHKAPEEPTHAQILYLRDAYVRRNRTLTVALVISRFSFKTDRSKYEPSPFDDAIAHACFDIDRLGQPSIPHQTAKILGTTYMSEHQPNPESRVTLTATRDALGMRRSRLAWKLAGSEIESIYRFAELFRRKISSIGYGRLKNPTAPHDLLDVLDTGFHHMGGTRMHVDPKHGAIDTNCRVHDSDNLYLAGSSVFPTSGAANPTFTIIAMTIRLADHLKQRLAA